jgi:hypothetical protein
MTGYPASPPIATIVIRGVVLAISCVISYWLITHILTYTYSVSRDDDLLGGMWTVVATIFVYRRGQKESVRSALSRMAATFISFVLCLAYFVFLPFQGLSTAAETADRSFWRPNAKRTSDPMPESLAI